MYNSTGLVDDQFNALYERLKTAIRNSLKQDKKPVQIPTVLGALFTAFLKCALTRGFAGRHAVCE